MDYPCRRSMRLPRFDYSAQGWYFVTTVTAHRRRLFARVVNGELRLTRAGRIVKATWRRIPRLNPGVTLGRFVVMPDHMHGLIRLGPAQHYGPRDGRLTTIIGSFKGAASREIRRGNPHFGPLWQRSFHEWVVRSENALCRFQGYIERNPERWITDRVR